MLCQGLDGSRLRRLFEKQAEALWKLCIPGFWVPSKLNWQDWFSQRQVLNPWHFFLIMTQNGSTKHYTIMLLQNMTCELVLLPKCVIVSDVSRFFYKNTCLINFAVMRPNLDETAHYKLRQQEAESLRRVAFYGVALSTIASLICALSVPMFYSYLQHVQSVMQNEVDFCKSRSSNIWREVTRTQVSSVANF